MIILHIQSSVLNKAAPRREDSLSRMKLNLHCLGWYPTVSHFSNFGDGFEVEMIIIERLFKKLACQYIRKGQMTENNKKENRLQIRNSTAEFLIFTSQAKEQGIEVRYEDETIWLSQKVITVLYDTSKANVSEHLKEIFETGELERDSTVRKFRTVQKEGNREVSREIEHYSLDAIIAVGYRVNSKRATQFRQWATQVLKEFAIKGYALDKKRLENGSYLGEDYFEKLLEDIREIRLSERKFYQKITDIYATSVDYNKDAPTTKEFFAKVQNKMHYSIHGQTAAELVVERADSTKPHMGLTSWENSPDGKILKTDVSIAKNYLTKEEINSLGRIVNAYLNL